MRPELIRAVAAIAAVSLCTGIALARQAESIGPVMVMPFAATGGPPHTTWLGEGVSVILMDTLQRRGVAVVTREERMRTFERLQLPQTADLSRATVIRAGQVVGASYIVSGSIDVSGEELVAHARAIRLDTGRLQPEIVERGPLTGLHETVERLTDRLERLNPLPRVSQRAPAVAARARPPLTAFEPYVKGLLADSPGSQVSLLQSALERFPGYDEAKLALWRVFTAQGEHQSALRQAQAVPAESPLNRGARFLAALSQISLQRYDDAFSTLKAFVEQGAVGPALNNMGVIQMRRPATAEAGRASYYFTKASEASPEDADYFFNLGYAYLRERDTQAAIYWLREAVRRSPLDGEAHFLLSIALLKASAAAEAIRERELAERLTIDFETLEKKRASADDGVPRALERLKHELKSDRASELEASLFKTEQREQQELATFYLDRGRRLFQTERDREAISDLRRSLFLSPYQPEPHLLLGRLYLRAGRSREAIDELKMSIWSGETAAAHLALAHVYEQTKDFAAARSELERVLQLTEGTPESPERKEATEMLMRIPKLSMYVSV
ncbi:MAG: tetratricopeptide repeat protein [Acidobacteria bacterium]|nr:tetratricopeptide repeat protein [Acidobacteriota bacterium]